MTQLEHTYTTPEFLKDSSYLQFALKGARIGVWEVQLDNNIVLWDDCCKQLFGLAKDNKLPYDQAVRYIHPDDLDSVNQAVQNALAGLDGGKYDKHYRTIGADDGKVRRVHFLGQAYFDDTKNPIRFGGIAIDETSRIELEKSEERFRSIFEQAPMALGLLEGRDFVVREANEIILHVWGKDESIIGNKLVDALPEIKDQIFISLLETVYDSGEAFYGYGVHAQLVRNGKLEDTYFDFVYTPLRDGNQAVTGVMVLAVEVTESFITKQELEESEKKYRELADSLPELVWTTDSRGRQTFASKRWKEFSGLDPNDASAFEKIVHPEDLDNITNAWNTSLTSGRNYRTEVRLKNKGNVYNWFLVNGQPVKNANDQIEKWIGSFTNITEQKRAEVSLITALRKIEESELMFRNITNSSPVGLWLSNEEGSLTYLNKTLVEWTGLPYEKLLGNGWANAIIDEDKTDSIEAFRVAIINQSHYDVKFRLNKGDGTVIWCHAAGDPYHDDNNRYCGYAGFCMDINNIVTVSELAVQQQKYAEHAEANLYNAIELAQLATWEMDVRTSKFSYSKRFMDWLGLSERANSVEEMYNLIPDVSREKVVKALQTAISNGSSGVYDIEHPIINRLNGRTRIIHVQGQVLYDFKRNPLLIKGTALDITAQKRLQRGLEEEVQERTEELASVNEELQSSNEELAATNEELSESNDLLINSNQQLEQYAYVASHDLQEPLRKILTFVNRLTTEPGLEQSHSTWINKINESANRMSLLIKSLLDFSRLLKTNDEKMEVDLNLILSQVVADFDLLAEEKGAVIELDEMPTIKGIQVQMNQLFYNLIGNALKFTTTSVRPKVIVKSKTFRDHSVKKYFAHNIASAYHHITIIDNGIGLEQKYAEQIFEIFKRLHDRSEYAGSGIGLALCKRIVVNHNGHIYIQSELNQGTQVHIILPAISDVAFTRSF